MPFITKLDFSNNRQVKQYIETNTSLSGGTTFGVPFSYLPTGASPTTSAVTVSYSGVLSTFSGNSGTTVYTWYDNNMNLGLSNLSALTPSISAITQNSGIVFTSATSTTTVDGNLVNLTYTGVSFDITPISFYDLGSGNYSGTVHTNLYEVLSAGTLDYTGRTIWVDVSGITRTQELIVTKAPSIGYVLTCVDLEGRVAFEPVSGATAGYWSAGTNTYAIAMNNSDSLSSGVNSVTEGYKTTAIGNYAHAEGSGTTAEGYSSHSEGQGSWAYGNESHAEGWGTTAYGDSSHAEGEFTKATNIASHAEGSGTTASGFASHAEGQATTASGDYSHAEGYKTTASNGEVGASHAEGFNTTAGNDYTHAGGKNSVASGVCSFVHGNNSTAYGNNTIVLGANITGSTANYTYVESFNIKTVGSSPFANDIRIAANGNLTTNTSDERLKENINPLTGSLNKIKQLNGVTYQWKDKNAGGDDIRIGFIAQQVEEVEPLLVFTNKVDGYKGIHIDGVIPMLVEAVKELSSGVITTGNVYLETQSIFAEDNNIDLNYSGTPQTAIGGGIRVLHALGENISAEMLTDSNGNWVTNNDFKPNAFTIPVYTPTSSSDTSGNEGNLTRDDNFLYVKTSMGWKRANLESF
jgi:hypothetical protein